MIRVEIREGVATITLARSEKRNALTPEMLDELRAAFASLEAGVRAVLLRGEGPAFCAGFDLRLCAQDSTGDTMRRLLDGLSQTVRAMRSAEPPVVLAVHGAAVAGGCALLGGADVVVAERRARLGYPVVRIGVSPAVSSPFLPTAPGPARSLQLDPELIPADHALRIGLVHEVTDGDDSTLARAEEIARHLAGKPGRGVAATKRLLNDLARPTTDHADAALQTSLSLTGGEEERARLAALWS